MRRLTLLIVLAMMSCFAEPLAWADRRSRNYPEIAIETGARTDTCDVMFFSPDGKRLLAAGDDKVVRIWPVHSDGLDHDQSTVLRWPSWREQRGGIKSVALSPDGKRVAVGGFGLVSGNVAIIDIDTGEIPHLTFPKAKPGENFGAVMTVVFDPTGEHVLLGTADGSVWRWKPGHDDDACSLVFKFDPIVKKAVGEEKPQPLPFNRVRFLGFMPGKESELIAVAESGFVQIHDLKTGTTRHTLNTREKIGGSDASNAYRAALSPDGSRLALCFGPDVVLYSLTDLKAAPVVVPGGGSITRALAFSKDGTRLAVSVGSVVPAKPQFVVQADDRILIVDLTQNPPVAKPGPIHSGQAEALAWHPDGRLAVAGGEHHQVTLWDLEHPEQPQDQLVSAGRCLYGVRISADGRYVAFRSERDPHATHPNQLGAGPWHGFDLRQRRPAELPTDIALPEPLRQADGWRVEPTTDGRLAVVKGTIRHRLPWNWDTQNYPTAYTFLPSKGPGEPVRLAVGHYNGYSLFEITNNSARVVRSGVGHTGNVTALAVAPEGDWLITCSNDQTLTAWNLAPFRSQAELGASFGLSEDNKSVVVKAIDDASPAWESGLKVGDEIRLLGVGTAILFNRTGMWSQDVGTEAGLLKALENPSPANVHYFVVKRDGQDELIHALTSVRQRPMWRLFPAFDPSGTKVTDWVMWMWHTPYYLTSTNGDYLIGWHVNDPTFKGKPQFYKAEQFRNFFERPELLAILINTHDVGQVLRIALGPNPVPIHFDELEPAPVRIVPDPDPKKWRTVRLVAKARADEDLRPKKADLWVNDFLWQSWDTGGKDFDQTVTIPEDVLRSGDNRLTLHTFNDLGGRGESIHELLTFQPENRPAPRLWGAAVGINDYGLHREIVGSKGGERAVFSNLSVAVQDAQMLHERWLAQKGLLYSDASLKLLSDADAGRDAILANLDRIAEQAGPDDLTVLFLSGHGDFVTIDPKTRRRTFVFCCPTYDRDTYHTTGIPTEDLYERLAKIRCRKLIFLDACHSGQAALNPARSFTPNGIGPVILAACDQNELAFEDPRYGNGLFTFSVLEALGEKFSEADGIVEGHGTRGELDPFELFVYVSERIPSLLEEIGKPADLQNPICFPRRPESFPIAKREMK